MFKLKEITKMARASKRGKQNSSADDSFEIDL